MDDVKKLLFYAQDSIHSLKFCLLMHGLRRGEVLGRRFSDIDRKAKTLALNKATVGTLSLLCGILGSAFKYARKLIWKKNNMLAQK